MRRSILFAVLALLTGTLAGAIVISYHFFYPKQYVKNEQGQYININVSQNDSPFPITKETTFEIEHFYQDEKRKLKEEVDDIPALLGCDKEGVLKYLEEYMKHISKDEQREGLMSFELVSYQGNKICFRKTYKKPVFSGYYAKSFNGTLVILNGDEKTVYEYTQIPIHILPEDLQQQVIDGYYLESEEDLYNFLETYSS